MKIQYYIIFSMALLLFSCSDEGTIPIYGCLDPNNSEYCSDCNVDDGSCVCEVDPNPIYTFNDIVSTLNDYDCSVCHFESSSLFESGPNLNLENYDDIELRISKCNSKESLLIEKITTGSMATYADNTLIEILEIWISEGAPE